MKSHFQTDSAFSKQPLPAKSSRYFKGNLETNPEVADRLIEDDVKIVLDVRGAGDARLGGSTEERQLEEFPCKDAKPSIKAPSCANTFFACSTEQAIVQQTTRLSSGSNVLDLPGTFTSILGCSRPPLLRHAVRRHRENPPTGFNIFRDRLDVHSGWFFKVISRQFKEAS